MEHLLLINPLTSAPKYTRAFSLNCHVCLFLVYSFWRFHLFWFCSPTDCFYWWYFKVNKSRIISLSVQLRLMEFYLTALLTDSLESVSASWSVFWVSYYISRGIVRLLIIYWYSIPDLFKFPYFNRTNSYITVKNVRLGMPEFQKCLEVGERQF